MSAFFNWRRCCGLLLLAALAGCNAKSSLNNDTTADAAPPANTQDGIATRVLDATKTDSWVYFNLADNAVVYPAQPDNSREWDIAFQRFKIKLNGGVSGTGGVRVAALKDTVFGSIQSVPATAQYYSDRALNDLSDRELRALNGNLFFSVCATDFTCVGATAIDRNHLNTDTAAYAFLILGSGFMNQGGTQTPILGWYDYFFDDNHRLAPTDDTWFIKTVDGIDIKFAMLGYYGLASSSEAGNMAFRYQSLTPGFTVPDTGAAQLMAAIAATPTQGIAPLPVQFSATVTGGTATQWLWDFGDGTSATTAIASHTYQTAGNYVATLIVVDQRGARASKTVPIVVNAAGNQPPVAHAGADRMIDLGAGVTQTQVTLDGSASLDNDGSIVSYRWSGSPKPNDDISPTVTLGIGRYVFTLTVTDNNGASASATVEITVTSPSNTPPVAHISATPASGAAPLAVQFGTSGSGDSDGSIVSYQWDFGDGNSATGATTSHSYMQAGYYTATLTVTDDGGAIATMTQVIDATLRFDVSADTSIYQFLPNGNLTNYSYTDLYVLNTGTGHSIATLLAFTTLDSALSTLTPGTYTAKLNLHVRCPDDTGFDTGCPGDSMVGGGVAALTTEIYTQNGAWSETGSLAWNGVVAGTKYGGFTVGSANPGWIGTDVTALVQHWASAGSTGDGIVLSAQAYSAIKNTADQFIALTFDSKESTDGNLYKPYLEIHLSP